MLSRILSRKLGRGIGFVKLVRILTLMGSLVSSSSNLGWRYAWSVVWGLILLGRLILKVGRLVLGLFPLVDWRYMGPIYLCSYTILVILFYFYSIKYALSLFFQMLLDGDYINLYIYIKPKPLVAPQFSTSTKHNI